MQLTKGRYFGSRSRNTEIPEVARRKHRTTHARREESGDHHAH